MQVLITIRSSVPGRGSDDAVAIYIMVNARKYVEVDEDQLIHEVLDVGGRDNRSCLFLPPGSKDKEVSSKTGKSKKSLKIPRKTISPQLLKKLDECKLAIKCAIHFPPITCI
jgi:hypothetical protein